MRRFFEPLPFGRGSRVGHTALAVRIEQNVAPALHRIGEAAVGEQLSEYVVGIERVVGDRGGVHVLEGRPDPVVSVAAGGPVHDVHADETEACPYAERLAGLAPGRRHRNQSVNGVVGPGLFAGAGVDDLPRCLQRDRAELASGPRRIVPIVAAGEVDHVAGLPEASLTFRRVETIGEDVLLGAVVHAGVEDDVVQVPIDQRLAARLENHVRCDFRGRARAARLIRASEPEHIPRLPVGVPDARQVRVDADLPTDGSPRFVRRPIEGHEGLPGEDVERVLRVLLEVEVDEGGVEVGVVLRHHRAQLVVGRRIAEAARHDVIGQGD